MRVAKIFLLGGGAVTIAALAVTTVAWAQQKLKPGSYEFTIEMALPGAPAPIAMTDTQCLTTDETRDLRSILQEQMATGSSCQFSEAVTKGDTMSWDTKCNDLTAKTEVTFTTDGFKGTATTTFEGTVVVAKFASKWIGACTGTTD